MLLDFKMELDKLLEQETSPLPQDEFSEITEAGRELLTSLNKKQEDISLQVEEIYDIVSQADTGVLQEAYQAEQQRAYGLAAAAVGLCDILEDFCAFALGSTDPVLERQARMMWKNAGNLLERSGITRLGEDGQPLDPELHTVQAAAPSLIPREHVARVLQSGYRYLGAVLRKAVVVVSEGTEGNADE